MSEIFHLSAKLIDNDSIINKAFGSIYQSIITRTKTFLSKDRIIKTILEHITILIKA